MFDNEYIININSNALKKIVLKEFKNKSKGGVYIRDNRYSLYFGSERFIYFNNKKSMEKFVADTNRLLNDSLYNLNMLYSQVYAEYREYWFIQEKNTIEHQLLEIFQRIFTVFNRCAYRTMEINVYSFRNLLCICDDLLHACNMLLEFYKSKNLYYKVRALNFKVQEISIIENTLQTWGNEYRTP